MAGVLQHSFDAMQNAYSKQVDLLRDLAEHRHQLIREMVAISTATGDGPPAPGGARAPAPAATNTKRKFDGDEGHQPSTKKKK
jgi:hypothetical protein